MKIGYYRLIDSIDDIFDKKDVGQLFYISEFNELNFSALLLNRSLKIPNQYLNLFEYCPDGFQQRQKEISDLMSDLNDISINQDQAIEMTSAIPCLTFSEGNDETSLILKDSNAQLTSDSIKIAKTKMAIYKSRITKKKTHLDLLLKEQYSILSEKTDILSKQIGMAMEAIYMINAYLGKDEQIVRIQDGEPASVDEKITIRQMVLFMDEETAHSDDWAKNNGMDFSNVKDFDNWVKEPSNLQLVLPDKKGIVAIKPRREDRYYSNNPFENIELNRLNKCLYLLIRNGDILYRIHTSLWLEDVLMPKKDEFEKLFLDYDKKPMHPGSPFYMQAMEKSDKLKRKFYTVMLLIQGIIDRTKIFHPIPTGKINICDIASSEQYFRFLRDAENSLGDGRPKFYDWLKSINKKTNVGTRVVGNWWQYIKYNKYAISPKTATIPYEDEIYIIEKLKDNKACFYFDYGLSRRASCEIYTSDVMYINFDEVSIEDAEYYISNRVHRKSYDNMIPLLKTVIRMKKKEQEEELPFKKLLISRIVEKYKCTFEKASDRVDELITWWKFKNKIKRSLLSDDEKALRMIVKQYEVILKLDVQKIKYKELQDDIVAKLKAKDEQLLAVFHRKDNQYVSFSYHNDEDVYVRERHWTDKLKCVFDKDEKIVDFRFNSWSKIWSHERWEKWQVNAIESKYLTNSQQKELIDFGFEKIKQMDHSGANKKWMKIFCVMKNENHISFYYVDSHALIPSKKSKTSEPPLIMTFTVSFDEDKTINCYPARKFSVNFKVPWGLESKERFAFYDTPKGSIVRFDKDLYDLIIEEYQLHKRFEKECEKFKDQFDPLEKQLDDFLLDNWYEKQHEIFCKNYIDPDGEYWLEYKDELEVPRLPYNNWVIKAAVFLKENNVEINGLKVSDFIKKSIKCGWKSPNLDDVFDLIKDVVLDLNYKSKRKKYG